MKRFLDILRAIVISPEMLFLAAFSLFAHLNQSYIISIASKTNTNEETIKYLALVPPSIIVFLYMRRDDLLFIDNHPKHNLIQEWPNFHMLLDRYWICILWGILGSVATVPIWIFNGDLSAINIFYLFFSGIITPIISLLTFFSATITIKRILSTTSVKPKV